MFAGQYRTLTREMTPIPPQSVPEEDETEPHPNNEGTGQLDEPDSGPRLEDYNDIAVLATLEELKTAQDFISQLQTATLDKDHNLDSETRERLQEPVTDPISLDADPELRTGIKLYLDTTNASDEVYNNVRNTLNSYVASIGVERENSIPSLYSVKKAIGELTGVYSMLNDMCIDSCMAYTGPNVDLDACLHCGKPRYDPQILAESGGQRKVPQRKFSTFPLGPQLQALWRNPHDAKAMRYRLLKTQKILEALQESNGEQEFWDDACCGSDYLEAFTSGKIAQDDMVLMLSIDGAQLYQSKQSDCWIYIWIVLDLAPDLRYKKRYVLIGAIIPGPNKPKNADSYLFPGLHHACALSKEGLKVWDAHQNRTFLSKLFLLLCAADGPGMTYLNGLTGHSGAYGCRLYCPTKGRRKIGGNHYYPALLKPAGEYSVDGCDHGDVQAMNLSIGSQVEYLEALEHLLSAQNPTRYQNYRRETGISKPSIFSGFPTDRILRVPSCFASDLMHLCSLNLTDLLLGLWRGTIECDPQDNKVSWDWAVLRGDTWKEHGKRVAEATPYLPGSFDRPPRNPAEKISSGYKAWEFLTYVYGLGPGLFYQVLPHPYWVNFCKLARGLRLLHQRSISTSQLIEGHRLLVTFVQEFEELYYQRKAHRLHFCRQSIHALLHLGPETPRIGPLAYSTQWCMERTIGILGSEIRQPSNPFQNLTERGLRRTRINALESIIPELVKPVSQPRISEDLGDGFILLGSRDRDARSININYIPAVHRYFTAIGISFSPNWIPCFKRWARVQLPNKQIVRTAWKEKSRSKSVRTSRNVMVSPVRLIVQVYSTFSLHIYSGLKSLTESKQQTLGRFSFSSVQPLPKTRQRGLPLFLSMAHLIKHFSMTQAMRYGYLHIKVMKI